ncbi:MAG: transcriptional regulator [Reyranella sp.]|jgi:DNA-binding HxlR family transcriptional regulator|nr:MAG: transcriptional regulator [Reyranella sp.]
MKTSDLEGRCPIDLAIEVIGGKWKPIILYRLGTGTLRYGELQRAVPKATQRMLTLQLRELERDGMLTRTVHPTVPPKVEYTLTEPARRLLPVLETMGQWLLDNHTKVRP